MAKENSQEILVLEEFGLKLILPTSTSPLQEEKKKNYDSGFVASLFVVG